MRCSTAAISVSHTSGTVAPICIRDGHLERLTHDHTWVQSLVDDGKISETEAAMHPHRSLLLKVLNGQPTNDPDLTMVPVMAGDRLMFCSDGVCGLIDDDVIEAALQLPTSTMPPSASSSNLSIEGGIDNITVIVADVVESGGNDDVLVLGAASEQPDPGSTARRAGSSRKTTKPSKRPSSHSLADFETTRDDEERYSPQAPHHDASVGRSSACSCSCSWLLPDWGWRTGGPAPSTSWAPTRTRSRSSRGCRTSIPGPVPVTGVRGTAADGQRAAAVLSGASQSQHRRPEPGLGPCDRRRADEAAKTMCQPTADELAQPDRLHQVRKPARHRARSRGKPSPTPSAAATDQTEPNC